MARVNPFHSPDQPVYHYCSNCTEGNNIEAKNKKSGTGGKRPCTHCQRLERERKC